MHLQKRLFLYFFLLLGICALQLTVSFRLKKNDFKTGLLVVQEEAEIQEVAKELFSGKGGPQEPSLLNLNILPYQVQSGDNLWEIAKKANLDLDTLISANKLKRANLINVGDILQLPNQKGVFHKVRKGQTISEIAEIYKVAVEEVLQINKIEDPKALSTNKEVFIPGGKLLKEEREYILGLGFIRPCRGWISSRYGWRRDPFTRRRAFHHGIDMAAPKGTPIYAARDGRITYSGWLGGYGRMLSIKHSRGYSTRYGHNSVNLVKKGQYVRQGQLIARVGNTGRSTGSHLHFEIRRWGRPLNPLPLVRRYAKRK